MSRIGKQKIEVPENVEVQTGAGFVKIKGPKGEMEILVQPESKVTWDDSVREITVGWEGPEDNTSMWGTTRSLINNAVLGVVDGFSKKLELVGIGFSVEVKDNAIEMTFGHEVPTVVKIPDGIEVEIPSSTEIVISGVDKQKVHDFAAHVRSKKKPEPYKGKGIRYEGEEIRRKQPKTTVATEV